jgi:hypothetical protein
VVADPFARLGRAGRLDRRNPLDGFGAVPALDSQAHGPDFAESVSNAGR